MRGGITNSVEVLGRGELHKRRYMPKKEISIDDLIGSKDTKIVKPKNKNKETKMSKTIKVSTLIISVAVILSIIISFIAGMIVSQKLNNDFEEQVNQKAQSIIDLKASK